MTRVATTGVLRAKWDALAPRERAMLALALVVVLGAAVWMLGVAPALRTLREVPAQMASADQAIQRMRSMAEEARGLQSQSRVNPDEALRSLEQSVRNRLGAGAQIVVAGERATVSVRGVAPDALVLWLSAVRQTSRALPVDARLTRAGAGWDGTIVLQLAPRN